MKVKAEHITGYDVFCHGRIAYDLPEEMIETYNISQAGFASILINDLNLEFDASGRIFSIWGYFPKNDWNEEAVSRPMSVRGIVRIDPPVSAGISRRVTEIGAFWPIKYDQSTGWIYVGEYGLHEAEGGHGEYIEIFENAILRLKAESIVGLWMKPEILNPK
ncbi:MAG TPA: hypothetical protein VF471_04440 [Pseudoxanthomonas sp.]